MNVRIPFRRGAIAAVIGLACVSQCAWAVDPFVVQDIRVEGLDRVHASTIFASMPVRVGEVYDDSKGSAAIHALFGLGLFENVEVIPQGSQLLVKVQERPTVNVVNVTSAKEFDKKLLLAAIAQMGVDSGKPYNKAAQDAAIQGLVQQYQARGYQDVKIEAIVSPVENNRVNVVFDIQEGQLARIREIRIVGNHDISESTLRGLMQQDTGTWMSWYTKSDRYNDTKLNTDVEAIRQYYYNNGYIDFQVNSAQATLSAEKDSLVITVDITEGPKYVVSGVSLAGNYLDKEPEFKDLITIQPGKPYKADDVSATVQAITTHFGNYGHAFAKVTPKMVIDREKQQVALVLEANPEQRAYVRRINVRGNTKTRDEVIRREFRQYEASWYNADKINLSKMRIDRLGYFAETSLEVQPVPGTSDQADLNVTVKERPTGSIQLGAGYSSSDGLGFNFDIGQDNVFGSGQSLGFGLATGRYNRTLSINSTDPYFTPDGVSRTFNVTYSTVKPNPAQGSSLFTYGMRQIGANVSFGVPISESNTIYLGAGFEQYKISGGKGGYLLLPGQYDFYMGHPKGLKGKRTATGIPLTLGWARDTRDSAVNPTSGTFQRVSLALSPAGDMRYFLGSYRFQYFHPLSRHFTFAVNTDLAYGKGLGGHLFPAFKHLYSGGLGSVRGFEDASLGLQAVTKDTPYSVGGNRKFNVNFELDSPFPGAQNDRTLRLFGFIDVGQVWPEKTAFSQAWQKNPVNANSKRLRASYGAGVRWISPMGPMSLALGFPLKKYPGDKLQKVQFQIGASF